MLTFTTSRLVDDTDVDNGPIGRSDSSDEGDVARPELGLGVRVDFVARAPDSWGRACFLGRAII